MKLVYFLAYVSIALAYEKSIWIGKKEDNQMLIWSQYKYTPFHEDIQSELEFNVDYLGSGSINWINLVELIFDTVRYIFITKITLSYAIRIP